MQIRKLGAALAAALALVSAGCTSLARSQAYSILQRDNGAFEPFRIADELHYVGASDIAVFAIDTGAGLIVIDAGYEFTARRVIENLKKQKLDPKSVKIILSTHAHMDHAGGLAELKRKTGASLRASPADAELLESGGLDDFFLGDWFTYPPVRVDETLEDGVPVRLGRMSLTPHFTPGHTRGCTSWSFDVTVAGERRRALVICSTSTLLYGLRRDPAYPGVVEDFRSTFTKLRGLECDVFLGAHGDFFDLKKKRRLQQKGDAAAFVFKADPRAPGRNGCTDFVDREEKMFEWRRGERWLPF